MLTFENIQRANEVIKTTPIKGKDYAEVNQRIKAFRMICPGGSIETEMLSNNNGVCVFKAVVADENGKILGTGTAYEKESSSFINKTSYIENCETSAVGRALGMVGIGIDTSVASYEEVANAIENQSDKKVDEPVESDPASVMITKAHWQALQKLAKRKGVSMMAVGRQYGFSKASEINMQLHDQIRKALEAMEDVAVE